MHIKQVIICGFRSYRDQTIISSFDNGHNVVIGRNGTGKSNFFDAIRFCLYMSHFQDLRQEERQSLLHEGLGRHVMSAFVEITFDNSDGRFPLDSNEVIFRRTIGIKKDEFFLNRKHVPKIQVMNMLESAGFSRSNPYYIVQQGKINQLSLMKDEEKLNLLKEVAGTKVYEERRKESTLLLHETGIKKDKIQDIIMYIEKRLQELDIEKNELKDYLNLDKKKRKYEYILYNKQLTHIKGKLDILENQRVEKSNNTKKFCLEKDNLDEKIKNIETTLTSRKNENQNYSNDIKQTENDVTELITKKNHLQVEINKIQDKMDATKTKIINKKKKLEELLPEIKRIQDKICNDIDPKQKQIEDTLRNVEKKLFKTDCENKHLTNKRNRKNQFSSLAERDQYLNKEISRLTELSMIKNKNLTLLNNYRQQNISKKKEKQILINEKEKIINLIKENILHEINNKFSILKEKRQRLSEERKELWRKQNELCEKRSSLIKILNKEKEEYNRMIPFETRKGLQFVSEFMNDKKNDTSLGIYGPLIELIQPVDDRFLTVLDVAAGGCLFYIVVDSDNTASKLLSLLNKNNAGRLTFLPLNRLQNNQKKLHKIKNKNDEIRKDSNCCLLKDNIRYEKKIENAVDTVFSKKMICSDLENCINKADYYNYDCYTLLGDVIFRKGGVNGGYKDPRKSRFIYYRKLKANEKEIELLNKELSNITERITRLDQEITETVSSLQLLENDRNSKQNELYNIHIPDHRQLEKELKESEIKNDDIINKIKDTEKLIEDTKQKIMANEKELLTNFDVELNENENRQLKAYEIKIQHLEEEKKLATDELVLIKSVKKKLLFLLNENLLKQKDELTESINDSSRDENETTWVEWPEHDLSNRLADLTKDLVYIDKEIQQNKDYIQGLSDKIDHNNKEILMKEDEILSVRKNLEKVLKNLSKENVDSEILVNDRKELLAKRENALRQIRDLGTMPQDIITDLVNDRKEYDEDDEADCMHKLKILNKELMRYNNINKKALDQYVIFSDKRNELIIRKEKVDEAYLSIKNLITVLDNKKNNALLQSFKSVSFHFSKVFKEIVPTGYAKMTILTEDDAPNNEDNRQPEYERVESFTGIQIQVNFRGEGNNYLMSQLSGGQKCLVALSFIFAIQRTDPAPFYLFDEIDQALDSTYRASIANLIYKQAHEIGTDKNIENKAQFITSTFRPELVEVADKFFGIGHQNKISNIYQMTKEESLHFIKDLMTEEVKEVNTIRNEKE